MKKNVKRLMCGVLLSSFILCGCNKVTETSASSVTASQTEPTTTAAETEPAPTEHHPQINIDNFKKISEGYAFKYPNGKEMIVSYIDGIRGYIGYHFAGDILHVEYSSGDGTSSLIATFDPGKVTSHVIYRMNYKGKAVQGEGDAGIESFEKFFDDVIARNASYVNEIESSALDEYSEEFKKDLAIVYSRFIAFADVIFSEYDLKLEDLGVDLGTKYRAVDPKQPTSMQLSVTNTHKFENGFCTDGDISWTEFYYDAVGTMGGMSGTGWRTYLGPSSATMFKPYDVVQYSTTNKKNADLMYHKAFVGNPDENEGFFIKVDDASTKKKKSLKVEMEYRLLLKNIKTRTGASAMKYNYIVTIKANPGQYGDVFASKESLAKYAKVYLYIIDHNGASTNAWGKKADIAKLQNKFIKDGCTYYTKEEIIDKLWEHHVNFLASIDNGMEYMGLSLADIGVSWNKNG